MGALRVVSLACSRIQFVIPIKHSESNKQLVIQCILEARAEILLKEFVGILVETMTPKEHFEI